MKSGPGATSQPNLDAATAAAASGDLPALRKFVAALLEKDLFARLRTTPTRGPIAALKATYIQLAKLFHPDTVPPDAPAEARALKADILSLLNEAYGTLSDDAQRVHYFDELEAKAQVGDLDLEAILNAEEDFQRATMMARARKFIEALALLQKCITINPKEGEFYAWRGYCRFFAAQDKRVQRDPALADLKLALEMNPRCVVAWLFRGHIAKLMDDVVGAKQAYGKTLELDPNNTEAQRELRLFAQRKR